MDSKTIELPEIHAADIISDALPNKLSIYALDDDRPRASICMIVKNEEANLERCLDSLLPIIVEPWCELIIVDTGSTDRTLEVARKFTEKVFEQTFEPWSFAAARNFSISKATGRKIFIMDADDVLKQESLYQLKDLLWNDAYTEPTAMVNVVSFYKRDKSEHADIMQARMFVNDGEFGYDDDYGYHNRPKCKIPYRQAGDIVIEHHGYDYETHPELQQQKVERTLPGLLEALETKPEDLHVITHIVKTYYTMNDWHKVIEWGERWSKLMSNVEYHEGWTAFLENFANLATAYLAKEMPKEAHDTELESRKYTEFIPAMDLLFHQWYLNHGDMDKAAEYAERALKGLDARQRDPYAQLITTNAHTHAPKLMNFLSTYYFTRREYDRSGKYLNNAITVSGVPVKFRWDIWNEENAAKNLLPKEA